MSFLEIVGPNFARWYLCGDGQDWSKRFVRIKETVDKVEIPRAAAACAYGEIAGQLGFGAGREGSHFLVAHVHPLHLLVVMNGIHDAIQGVANDPINSADARIYQRLYQMFSYGCHGFARLFL
jgi:hypothetical protein